MKKYLVRGMVLLTLLFTLVGCGKKDQGGDGTYKDVKTSEIEAAVAKSLGDNVIIITQPWRLMLIT